MPEGAEVTWMVRQIRPVLIGHVMTSVPATVRGRVTDVVNKGKTVWIVVQAGETRRYVKIVPAMTGVLRVTPGDYTRWTIRAAGVPAVWFDDPRKFGKVTVQTQKQYEADQARLGVFPLATKLTAGTTADVLARMRRHPRAAVADVLLDQGVIAGVGNYLRADALYVARVAPTRTIEALSDSDLIRVIRAVWKVMNESYRYQLGHGLRSYPFKVYGQDWATRLKWHGRTVWWDPARQK